eukprot:scaffold1738_cov171-Pinguiococcus_pyrenoidosus.AAC.3
MASHEKTPFSDRSRPMLLPLSSIIRLYEAISERSSRTFPGVERMRVAAPQFGRIGGRVFCSVFQSPRGGCHMAPQMTN